MSLIISGFCILDSRINDKSNTKANAVYGTVGEPRRTEITIKTLTINESNLIPLKCQKYYRSTV